MKKERKSTPAPKGGRGRPKKGVQNADESDSHDESNKDVPMTDAESKSEENKKDVALVENNTHEEKEESANNNAESSAKVKFETIN